MYFSLPILYERLNKKYLILRYFDKTVKQREGHRIAHSMGARFESMSFVVNILASKLKIVNNRY